MNYERDEAAGVYRFSDGTELTDEQVRTLARSYSYAAAGLTARECASRLGLDTETVKRLLRALGLTHASPPLAPHEPLSLDAVAEAVDATDLSRSWESQAAKYWQKRCAKAEQTIADIRTWWRHELEPVRAARHVLPPIVTRPYVDLDEEPWTAVLCWSDWHIGHCGMESITERLALLLEQTRSLLQTSTRPLDGVVIATLGDLVDGAGAPLGGPGVDGLLHQEVRGPAQIRLAAELLSRAVAYVCRIVQDECAVSVVSVHGNHDRVTSSKDVDRIGLAGWATATLAGAMTEAPNLEAWHVAEDSGPVVPVDLEHYGTRLLLHHGHAASKNAQALATVWRDEPWIEHMAVVNGHYHHSALRHWTDVAVTHVQCGALPGPSADKSRVGKAAPAEQTVVGVDWSGPYVARTFRLSGRETL